MIKYEAHITDGKTGETVVEQSGYSYTESDLIYLWSDGNYGCDCNREMMFCRAKDMPEPEEKECTEERFKVKLFVDGHKIYED